MIKAIFDPILGKIRMQDSDSDPGADGADVTKFEVYATDEIIPAGTVDEVTGLAYAVDVPAGMKHMFRLRSDVAMENNDVVIDWGDGEESSIAEGEFDSIDTSEYETNGELKYSFAHTYETPGRYIVTIKGHDYWGMQTCKGASILSRIFAADLPLASCVSSLASAAVWSPKLQKVLIPTGMNLFSRINHAGNLFENDHNLLSVTNLKTKFQFVRYVKHMFLGDTHLQECDLILPPGCIEKSGYQGVFQECSSLTGDISRFFPAGGFAGASVTLTKTFYGCSLLTGTLPADILWNDLRIDWTVSDVFTGCSDEILAQVPASWGGTDDDSVKAQEQLRNLQNNYSLEIGSDNVPLETATEVTDDDGNTVYQTDENGEQILDDEGNPIPETETERAFQCFVRGSGNSYGSSVTIHGDNNENSLGFVRIYGSNNKTYQFQNIFGDLNELTASVNVTVFGNSNKDNGKNANGAFIIGNLNEVTGANTFTAGYRVKNSAKGARAIGRYFTLEDTPENEYAFALGDGELDGTTPTGEISLIHRVFKAVENPLFNPDSLADDSDASDPNPEDSSGERKYVAERAYTTEYRGHFLAVTKLIADTGTVTLDHDQYARWNLTASGEITLALSNWKDGDSGELIVDTTKQAISIPADWVTLGADITTTPGVYVLEIAQVEDTIFYAIKYPDSGDHITVDSALSASSTNPVQNKVINTALAAKAPLASPSFTGTPKVPTAAAGTNTTQAASTAFVKTAVDNATITVDSALSASSTNPVQNKVINAALAAKVSLAGAETITGQKTFTANPIYSGDQPKFYGMGANLTKGTAPATDKTYEMIFCDKNGMADANKVAAFTLNYTTEGDVRAGLRAFQGVNGSTLSSFFDLVYPASGSPYITTDAVVDPDCGSLIGTIYKSLNGYVVFPNGLIIQWGTAYMYSGEYSVEVTFPVTFSNTPKVVPYIMDACDVPYVKAYPTTSYVSFVRRSSEYTASIDYIAIGY